MNLPRERIISTRTRPEDRVTYSIPTIEDPVLHLIIYDKVPIEEEPSGTVNHVFFPHWWRRKRDHNIWMQPERYQPSFSMATIIFPLPIIIVLTTYLQNPSEISQA